jgi:hypothetical protein
VSQHAADAGQVLQLIDLRQLRLHFRREDEPLGDRVAKDERADEANATVTASGSRSGVRRASVWRYQAAGDGIAALLVAAGEPLPELARHPANADLVDVPPEQLLAVEDVDAGAHQYQRRDTEP